MSQYSKESINSFVDEINKIADARERWLTNIHVYDNEYYEFSMSILYIDKIFTAFNDVVLIILTSDCRELKFRIGENTILEISKK